jgi:hypothetical protein
VFGYGLNAVVGQEQVVQMNLMLESVVGQIRDSVVAEISALGIEMRIKIKKRNVQSSCHFDVYLHEAEAPAVGEIG